MNNLLLAIELDHIRSFLTEAKNCFDYFISYKNNNKVLHKSMNSVNRLIIGALERAAHQNASFWFEFKLGLWYSDTLSDQKLKIILKSPMHRKGSSVEFCWCALRPTMQRVFCFRQDLHPPTSSRLNSCRWIHFCLKSPKAWHHIETELWLWEKSSNN